jgi:hypothetical protein
MDSEKEIIENMHKYYRNKVPIEINCTKCGSNTNVIPAVYGFPDKELA